MANTKTAKANIKINARNHLRAQAYRSRMKTAIRQALEAVESNHDDAVGIVRSALRIIDKTVSKGVIKKKTAARRKSRIAKLASSLTTAPAKKAATKTVSKPKTATKAAKTTTTKSSDTTAAPKKEPAKKSTAKAAKTETVTPEASQSDA